MATLDRAVALAKVDCVAMGVGEHLHFDVPRIRDRAFENSVPSPNADSASERAARSAPADPRALDPSHAASAAAAAALIITGSRCALPRRERVVRLVLAL